MMKSDYLQFINVPIKQADDVYKVNTDTIILGMTLDCLKGKNIFDIGTNTGALLLYAHSKGANYLYGIDINSKALKLAKENISNITESFELFEGRVQEFENKDKYDVVICNPPFFEMNNVTVNNNIKDAMFEESLPLDDLFKAFRKLMKEDGEVYMIYQADRFNELYSMCLKYKLKIMKMRFVHDVKKEFAIRVILKLKVGKMTKLRVLKPIFIDNKKIENLVI